jgi:hypothetical protein
VRLAIKVIKETPVLPAQQAYRVIPETKATPELRAIKAKPVQVEALLWWCHLLRNNQQPD